MAGLTWSAWAQEPPQARPVSNSVSAEERTLPPIGAPPKPQPGALTNRPPTPNAAPAAEPATIESAGPPKPEPWTPESVAPLLEPVLANVPATGLLLFEVIPDSQAAKHGFRPGDILTHYDGQPVQSADMLRKLFTRMGATGRKTALVIVRRGGEDLESTFDFAPLGVRFVPVQEGEKRVLQAADSGVEPNLNPLRAVIQSGSRFELLHALTGGSPAEQPSGWAREFFVAHEGRLFYRRQQAVHLGAETKREDVMIEFVIDRYLTPSRYWLAVNEKLILDFRREGSQWVGLRVGIPLRVDLPADTVMDLLAGLVALTLPTETGACRRCSYVDSVSGAHTPAPFGALMGVRWEQVEVQRQPMPAFRFDQQVMGARIASFWVGAGGELLAAQRGDGFHAVLARPDVVGLHFPKDGQLFPPINQLPVSTTDKAGP